jgi:hypothetical protein
MTKIIMLNSEFIESFNEIIVINVKTLSSHPNFFNNSLWTFLNKNNTLTTHSNINDIINIIYIGDTCYIDNTIKPILTIKEKNDIEQGIVFDTLSNNKQTKVTSWYHTEGIYIQKWVVDDGIYRLG